MDTSNTAPPARSTFQVSASEAGQRLDHFLQFKMPDHSRSRLQEWIRAGRVRIDGLASKPSMPLKDGQEVEVEPAEPPPLKAFAEELPFEVLYEDEAVIAVNKPAGMVVHAGAGNYAGTLVNALLHRYGSLSQTSGPLRPGIVHRLDRFTSGVILVARTDAAHRALAAQFAARTVEKTYLALVHGAVKAEQGRVDKPVTRDPVRRVRMTAALGRGREARSEYRVLRRCQDYTLLEVRIGTGRTHQIRVHLASIGHPVAGDRLYGAPAKAPVPAPGRYFLHAQRLRFVSPGTGGAVTVEAPLPADLVAWLEGLL